MDGDCVLGIWRDLVSPSVWVWLWLWVERWEIMHNSIIRLESIPVKGYARLTDGGIHRVEEGCVLTGEVVPPVTDEVLLVEYGAVGTKEGVLAPTAVTNVENL